jgi:hypothetical protein
MLKKIKQPLPRGSKPISGYNFAFWRLADAANNGASGRAIFFYLQLKQSF